MVVIPESLINKLAPLGPHFCLVEARGKSPDVGGKEWQKHPLNADDPKLLQWLQSGGNYGVVTGFGLTIVETDIPELQEAAKAKLPETFTVLSPGHQGWHLYYISSLEKAIRLRDEKGGSVGEVQGPGKMVLGPNSVHPNGKVYKIINDRPLAQVTREQLVEALKPWVIPDRETDLVEALAKHERKQSNVDLSILQVVPLAGLHRQGDEYYGPHPVHGSDTGHNFWVNPSKNCWHCFRHKTGGGPLLWLAVEDGIIRCEDAGPGALRGEVFKRVLEKARLRGLVKETQHEKVTAYTVGGDGGFVPAKLAENIMKKYTFATMMDNEETYVYLDGFYQPLGDVLIKKTVKEELQDEYRKNRALEVLDFIKASTYTARREEPPHLILLDNGVLDLSKDTFELRPHNPEYIFFNKIPVKYDPEADCPAIKKFMREITNSEEDVAILEEVLGFCLYREYFIAKALMLVGDGANGKSTFLNLVKAFLGPQNVSGRSLQDLEVHRFAKADLHTKLANIYADLPDRALQSTGTFKMLTGRDLIAAEKKFSQPFHFANYAKLLFSANKVPEANDDSSAFFRRWIIIVFPKVFTGGNADPYILEKLTTETELSGLLNLALAGLRRLLETGQFSNSKNTEEVKEDYIRKSSPIAAFLMDCIETDSDAFIEKKALYKVFAAYCREKNLPIVTETTFFKNLPQHVAVIDLRAAIAKDRLHAFKGIRYSEGVASVSSVSRDFLILSSRRGDFEKDPWKITEVPDESTYIKIGIALDTLDTPAMKQQQQSALDFLDHVDKNKQESHKLRPCLASGLEKKPNSLLPSENIKQESLFFYRHVPPAEPCELCGQLAVEWEIKLPDGTVLRRCNNCFVEMRRMYVNAVWESMEDS
jgi:putative DNA primase/helicase